MVPTGAPPLSISTLRAPSLFTANHPTLSACHWRHKNEPHQLVSPLCIRQFSSPSSNISHHHHSMRCSPSNLFLAFSPLSPLLFATSHMSVPAFTTTSRSRYASFIYSISLQHSGVSHLTLTFTLLHQLRLLQLVTTLHLYSLLIRASCTTTSAPKCILGIRCIFEK